MKTIRHSLFCIFTLLLLVSCQDDLDDVIRPASDLEIKNFIWRAMNDMYLYKAEVPALADDRFEDQAALDNFLRGFSTPEDLFYDGLLANHDEFSFLVEDYRQLEKSLDGINLSNGMQFGLIRYTENSSEVLGYVRYVLPNTSAEAQGIRRGDLFNSVDGEQLMVDNFSRLLEPSTYTIGLAQLNGNEIVPTGETITLQKSEYTSNPVFIAKTLSTSKGKVGYLMYNAFTGNFDAVLNATFGMFKAEGIVDLIVDLRYNGGGSVETANDLASMITGQYNGEIFYKEQWNDDYQAFLETTAPESLVNRFNNRINTGATINSLGLTRVYFITTLRTASASELLINGLKPYIEVVQVGERTTGKFQASTTLYDSPNFRRTGASLDHTYAVQPLIYKTLNAAGVTDYVNGLLPDVEINEDVRQLGVLGDPSEPLLAATINIIEGKAAEMQAKKDFRYEVIGEAGMNDLLYQKMYVNEGLQNLQ
ncbi:S41 family peptidase [Salinimicrobium oceani]|uniref:Peptidase S41 n=1 Tax=Salinimicrobium oceani TaxID=2722702 RepID=A0ABX1D1M4_9FLAO|nr:S41 family peptidase [Salinimicrobium oceani]NJW52756.1 peptidase S41 [Salinimicrobium oceani]